jgi:hypothetical protein
MKLAIIQKIACNDKDVGLDKYGNAYNTEIPYDLDRFDEVIKSRGKKSKFTDYVALTDVDCCNPLRLTNVMVIVVIN